MKTSEYPIIKTKVPGLTREFNLADPSERQEYYGAKAGRDIKKIQKFLTKNTLLVNMIGKKNSGKGTYSQNFAEAVGKDKVVLVSIGDLVRTFSEKGNFEDLRKYYRGFISFDEAVKRFLSRSTKELVPTEFILAMLKHSIVKNPGKVMFIDGLPRDLDQVSYALYLRDLIDHSSVPDLFVLIDIPESLMDFRIRTRTICPSCQATKNIKTNPTKFIEFDEKKKEFYMLCDNPTCNKARFVPKEGDQAGIEPLRSRLEKEGQVMDAVSKIHGVPILYLRNSTPTKAVSDYMNNYELAPNYEFKVDKDGQITHKKLPFVFTDDEGNESVTTFPPAITVGFIKQMVSALKL